MHTYAWTTSVVTDMQPLEVELRYCDGTDRLQQPAAMPLFGRLLAGAFQMYRSLAAELEPNRGFRNKPKTQPKYSGAEQPRFEIDLLAETACLPGADSAQRVSKLTLSMPLSCPTAGTVIRPRKDRKLRGLWMRLQDAAKDEVNVVLYSEPIGDPNSGKRKGGKSKQRELDRFPAENGSVLTYWGGPGTVSVMHQSTPLVFWRVDKDRFPLGPADELRWNTAARLKVGDLLGAPWDDIRLTRIYDKVLARAGFKCLEDGSNALGNYRFSFPYYYPGPALKSERCPAALHDIAATCQGIPPHEWYDYVMSLEGLPISSISWPQSDREDEEESAEPPRPKRHDGEDSRPRHACYRGDCVLCELYGTRRLFSLLWNGRLIYLVDDSRPRGAFALRVYEVYESARAYAEGSQVGLEQVLFRIWHSGNEQEWMQRLYAQLTKRFGEREPELD